MSVMINAGAFVIRKTDLDCEKKRITDLAEKNLRNLSLLNVQTVRNKCFPMRDFVIENSIDIFCMSEA